MLELVNNLMVSFNLDFTLFSSFEESIVVSDSLYIFLMCFRLWFLEGYVDLFSLFF